MSGRFRSEPPAAEEDVIRAALHAVARQDMDALLELLHPEIEWRPPEQGTLERVYCGTDGVRRLFEQLFDAWARIDHEDIAVEWIGSTLVVVSEVTLYGRLSRMGIEAPWGYAVEFQDGKIRSVRMYTSPAEAYDFARAGAA